MKTYKLVFIDLDETLMDFYLAEKQALSLSFRQFGLEYSERAILEYDEINAGVWRKLERGEIDQETLKVERFRLLFERMHADVDPAAFSALYLLELGKGVFLLPGAEETCAYLSSKYALAVVTNGIKEVQRSRISRSPLEPYFSALIISEEAGSSKPAPAIFEHACDRLGFRDKDRMIMVGDSLSSDIRGGINFGIDTCWFNPGSKANDSGLQPTYEIQTLSELMTIL